MKRKTQPTGYWTFMCNPRMWEIDKFLSSEQVEDSFRIIPYQKNWFEVGQLGVIRVGIDRRNKKELGNRQRLSPGVYALAQVASPPQWMLPSLDKAYLHPPKASLEKSLRVKIQIVKNLLPAPLLFEEIKHDSRIQEDPYLIRGFQGASMPLHPLAIQAILEKVEPGF